MVKASIAEQGQVRALAASEDMSDFKAQQEFSALSDDQQKLWLFMEVRKVNGRARDAVAIAELLRPIVMKMKVEEEHEDLVAVAAAKANEDIKKHVTKWAQRITAGAVAAPGVFLGILKVIDYLQG